MTANLKFSQIKTFFPFNLDKKKPDFNEKRELELLKEKYLLSTILLDRLSKKDILKAEQKIKKFKIYSTKKNQEFLNDAIWLINYAEKGNKISGYLFEIKRIFSPKTLKKRLYIFNYVFYKGKACNSIKKLNKLVFVLKITVQLERILDLWELESFEFKTYLEKYIFLSQLNAYTKIILDEEEKKGEFI